MIVGSRSHLMTQHWQTSTDSTDRPVHFFILCKMKRNRHRMYTQIKHYILHIQENIHVQCAFLIFYSWEADFASQPCPSERERESGRESPDLLLHAPRNTFTQTHTHMLSFCICAFQSNSIVASLSYSSHILITSQPPRFPPTASAGGPPPLTTSISPISSIPSISSLF